MGEGERILDGQNDLTELVTRITLEVLRQVGPPGGAGAAAPAAPIEAGPVVVCQCNGDDLSSCVSCGHCVVLRDDMGAFLDAGVDRLASRPGLQRVEVPLAKLIDHTLLKPDVTEEDLLLLCREALEHNFASVCVNSANVPLVARELRGSPVATTAVVGFPLGAMSTAAKEAETRDAVQHGADEIDMVVNIGLLKSGSYRTVLEDIQAVVRAAQGRTVKVILETALLDEISKIAACVLSKAAGAHFVKTSTGFGPKGATIEDVQLMRRMVGSDLGVKASGGIRDRETACKMIQAGATRIGASASVGIVSGADDQGGGY